MQSDYRDFLVFTWFPVLLRLNITEIQRAKLRNDVDTIFLTKLKTLFIFLQFSTGVFFCFQTQPRIIHYIYMSFLLKSSQGCGNASVFYHLETFQGCWYFVECVSVWIFQLDWDYRYFLFSLNSFFPFFFFSGNSDTECWYRIIVPPSVKEKYVVIVSPCRRRIDWAEEKLNALWKNN